MTGKLLVASLLWAPTEVVYSGLKPQINFSVKLFLSLPSCYRMTQESLIKSAFCLHGPVKGKKQHNLQLHWKEGAPRKG